ncbi:hypothetical protein [Methylomonas albis]|nr:hypothetical protein [Methylomonas albis]
MISRFIALIIDCQISACQTIVHLVTLLVLTIYTKHTF